MLKTEYQELEKKRIKRYLDANPPDLKSIKDRVWMENGLLDNSIRRDAWILFLGEDPTALLTCPGSSFRVYNKQIDYKEEYREENQIRLDIMRSFIHFDGFEKVDDDTLQNHRNQLNRVIKAILMEDVSLFYYQGYHDIVEFLLLFSNFDMDWTYTMMKALTKQYLRDYMHSNMTEVEKLLQLLYPILEVRASNLVPILRNPEKSPIVILPWIITLFTHSLSSLEQVARLFDVMLLHPLMPLYVAASVILHFRSELLATEERCQVYQILGKLNKYELPLETILRDTQYFYTAIPPSTLLIRGSKQGIRLDEKSMVLMHEKKALLDKKTSSNSLYQLIVHPGEIGVSRSTVGFISLATIGLAVAYLVQLVINSSS